MAFAFLLLLFSLISYPSFVYAIPPPETLLFIGGGVIAPFLFILGIFGLLLNYLWVKTKLFVIWRVYLTRAIAGLGIGVVVLLFIIWADAASKTQISNIIVTPEEVVQWQKLKDFPLILDMRGKKDY